MEQKFASDTQQYPKFDLGTGKRLHDLFRIWSIDSRPLPRAAAQPDEAPVAAEAPLGWKSASGVIHDLRRMQCTARDLILMQCSVMPKWRPSTVMGPSPTAGLLEKSTDDSIGLVACVRV